jgi:hypothetical protein
MIKDRASEISYPQVPQRQACGDQHDGNVGTFVAHVPGDGGQLQEGKVKDYSGDGWRKQIL